MNKSSRFRSRAVVLGASNVRRSLFPALEELLQVLPRPADLLFACGHGRSYCRFNRVLGWSLPGLSQAAWGEAWHADDVDHRFGIVTDVGNDLLYGVEPDALAAHVRICLDAISNADRVLILGPPIERLNRVRESQFVLFRKIFFPGSTISLKSAMDGAHQVNHALERMAFEGRYAWCSPPDAWYGIDPIHIRHRLLKSVWRILANRLQSDDEKRFETDLSLARENRKQRPTLESPLGLRDRLRLVFSRAKHESWFGWCRDQDQPVLRLNDGSQVSFF